MAAWPSLPVQDWVPTRQTLHRYCQVVGKVRMALTPFRNHWWHVTLRVDTRGLSTGRMPLPDGRSAEIAFDFVDHRLTLDPSDGRRTSFPLADGLACGTFYGHLFEELAAAGVDVSINPKPFALDGPALS